MDIFSSRLHYDNNPVKTSSGLSMTLGMFTLTKPLSHLLYRARMKGIRSLHITTKEML